MFATSERVSPCSARWSRRSDGRLTRIWPSACSICMSRETRSWSSPFGPLTRTSSGSTVSWTPEGTGMGCLPIRGPGLPDLRDDLAADAGTAGVVTGHQAVGSGDDRRAHAAEDARDVLRGDVGAATRLGDTPQARDHRAAVLRVLELHAQRLAHAGALDVPAFDVALLLEDSGQLRLHLRVRDHDLVVAGAQPVADAGKEVCDRVRHRHRAAPTSSTSSHPG